MAMVGALCLIGAVCVGVTGDTTLATMAVAIGILSMLPLALAFRQMAGINRTHRLLWKQLSRLHPDCGLESFALTRLTEEIKLFYLTSNGKVATVDAVRYLDPATRVYDGVKAFMVNYRTTGLRGGPRSDHYYLYLPGGDSYHWRVQPDTIREGCGGVTWNVSDQVTRQEIHGTNLEDVMAQTLRFVVCSMQTKTA